MNDRDIELRNLLERMGTVAGAFGVPNDANAKVTVFQTPLHIAAIWGELTAVKLLIESGALLDVEGEHGYTPLHEAVEQGHANIVKYLIMAGARTDITNSNGFTPKALAEIIGDSDVIDAFSAISP